MYQTIGPTLRFDGEKEMTKEIGKSQSVQFRLQSEDTDINMGVSNSKVPQHLSTFSSLRNFWEPRENSPARKPTLVQRKIVLTEHGFSLVRTPTNKRKGESNTNGSAGKRNRPG